jgi:hypothetical protein
MIPARRGGHCQADRGLGATAHADRSDRCVGLCKRVDRARAAGLLDAWIKEVDPASRPMAPRVLCFAACPATAAASVTCPGRENKRRMVPRGKGQILRPVRPWQSENGGDMPR